MSATAPEPPPATPDPTTDPPAQEIDWKAMARKHEAHAKENAAAAKKLAELEEASKTETQRLTDRAAKAEAELASVPAKVAGELRSHLVALGVVAKEDEVLLTASDPDSLLAQIKRLSERSDTRRKGGNVVPREGNNPKSDGDGDMREFTRALFAKAD